MYYAILIGPHEPGKLLDHIEGFATHEEALFFAGIANTEFAKEYASEDAYKNADSWEWIVLNAAEAEADYPEIFEAYKNWME